MTLAALLALLAGATLARAQTPAKMPVATSDQFLWLEELNGARAMAWVKEQNAKTLAVLQNDPNFSALYADALKIAQAKDRIPVPSFIGGQVYNFWQDTDHVRGIWRRTTPADYAGAAPNWTTVLDLDALARSENANWVWKGADCVWPAENRCMVILSDGGEDAITAREFDLSSATFVDGGLVLPRGKQRFGVGERRYAFGVARVVARRTDRIGLPLRRQTRRSRQAALRSGRSLPRQQVRRRLRRYATGTARRRRDTPSC